MTIFLSPSQNMPRNAAQLASACAGWFCMVIAEAWCLHAGFVHRCVQSLGDGLTFWYTEHRSSVGLLGVPDSEIPANPRRGTPVLLSIFSHFVDRR